MRKKSKSVVVRLPAGWSEADHDVFLTSFFNLWYTVNKGERLVGGGIDVYGVGEFDITSGLETAMRQAGYDFSARKTIHHLMLDDGNGAFPISPTELQLLQKEGRVRLLDREELEDYPQDTFTWESLEGMNAEKIVMDYLRDHPIGELCYLDEKPKT